MHNLAFIDGQNLHMGTKENNWKIDHQKFRIYLKDKYKVDIAYYFIGYLSCDEILLYKNLLQAGFVVIFKNTNSQISSHKKGNIDTDLVFEVMKNLVDNKLNQTVIVSSDGDYSKLVKYLISKNNFLKILFPSRRSSSLYNHLGSEYFDYLDNLKQYIEYKNKKSS